MSLEARIQAVIATYRAEAQKLELEGIAARRPIVREALQAEALRVWSVAAILQDIVDAREVAA